MLDNNKIKSNFKRHFENVLKENLSFRLLLLDIFVEGTAYIVGGYFRDFLLKRQSRDIDIIVDLPHDKLIAKIIESGIQHEINRHKGIKLQLDTKEVDIWSIENNWAFKQKLVKLNHEDKLLSIAKGCFYNYDALVINLHTFNFNIRYFTDFVSTRNLEILQEKVLYKKLNPTVEANILRAFYIQKSTGAKFSENTKGYLLKKIGQLADDHESSVSHLNNIKRKYPKYDKTLKDIDIYILVNEIIKGMVHKQQFFLDL